VKIAHLADIHVRGLSRHDEIRTVIEAFCVSARERGCTHIVIAGDIFHTKTTGITAEYIDLMTWMFRAMAEVAHVHVTLGNHDGALTNFSRQDAISPIIVALADPRITLYKQSGVFPMEPGVNLCVYSLFDREGWDAVKPVDGDYNIAVYHGSVGGAVSEDGWLLKSEVTVQWFEDMKYDIVLLGDIHKQQYLGYREYE
jgi:DNA repair exonuclease SbcCD nuclease subunit